ncbi:MULTISPECIES: hypothetical protein [unclassified Streptomyces]|uniref:hypothetical protein n=1 Tax=unclassified Streptomyces TaxID=2593676 RepID=UPI00081B54E1|nr:MULTISPECIES: hypothetical protein [unclassified Streptomyces]MYQ86492.1 hypothetical protein [Streptomyces sp. SID4936]SCE25010.1 hypothetical protein GA0115234_106963 [Streptomyces sp. DvalAA-43]
MAKKKTTKSSKRRQQVLARREHVLYPGYVFCPLAEAEQALGAARAGELLGLYGGELRKADVQLERVLREEQFRVVDTAHPDGQAWTLREYMDDWNRDLAADAEQTGEEYDLLSDEQAVVEMLHYWHRSDRICITRDGVIEWQPL